MNLYVIGAGCSKAYDKSFSKQKMPVAKDFFKVLNNLPNINKNRTALVGAIVLAMEELLGRTRIDPFKDDFDIEEIHTLIESKLFEALDNKDIEGQHHYFKVYTQLVFLFSCLVNEIAQGPVSNAHVNIAKTLKEGDSIITFNWDTLLDRALSEHTQWNTKSGYYVKPAGVYNNEWLVNENIQDYKGPFLLKMHGSANWLTGAMTIDRGEKQFSSMQAVPTEIFFTYEHSEGPYSCYDGRWEKVYEPFTYGYYPPNLPLEEKLPEEGFMRVSAIPRGFPFPPAGKHDSSGLTSMPLIIPPVKKKTYEYFGKLFDKIWEKAESEIIRADTITFIGYSFPITDTQTINLFKSAFLKRKSIPTVNIIDPSPERIIELMMYTFGIPLEKLNVYKEYFSEGMELEKIVAPK